MTIDIAQVFRDKQLLEDIRSEIRRIQRMLGHRIMDIHFPQMAIYASLLEVAQGMTDQFSVTFCGIPVQLSDDGAVHIRHFVEGPSGDVLMYNSTKELPAGYGITH